MISRQAVSSRVHEQSTTGSRRLAGARPRVSGPAKLVRVLPTAGKNRTGFEVDRAANNTTSRAPPRTRSDWPFLRRRLTVVMMGLQELGAAVSLDWCKAK